MTTDHDNTGDPPAEQIIARAEADAERREREARRDAVVRPDTLRVNETGSKPAQDGQDEGEARQAD